MNYQDWTSVRWVECTVGREYRRPSVRWAEYIVVPAAPVSIKRGPLMRLFYVDEGTMMLWGLFVD